MRLLAGLLVALVAGCTSAAEPTNLPAAGCEAPAVTTSAGDCSVPGVPPDQCAPGFEPHMRKLALDLTVARRYALPFVLGELGQPIPGASSGMCGRGNRHDLAPLLSAVFERGIDAAFIWGEGRCGLDIGDGRRIVVGAGADSAEFDAADQATSRQLAAARARLNGAPR